MRKKRNGKKRKKNGKKRNGKNNGKEKREKATEENMQANGRTFLLYPFLRSEHTRMERLEIFGDVEMYACKH